MAGFIAITDDRSKGLAMRSCTKVLGICIVLKDRYEDGPRCLVLARIILQQDYGASNK